MAKYRHKPIIVEAEQWFPDHSIPTVFHPVAEALRRARNLLPEEGLWIGCSADDQAYSAVIHPGDWIVMENDGFQSLYLAIEFETCYEPV